MRLESDGLLKVNADSLVGARANTRVGRGAVISVRDVSIRCEVETVRVNNAETIEGVTTESRKATYDRTGDGANFDAGEGHRTLLAKDARTCQHSRTPEYDSCAPSVVDGGPTIPESPCVDGSNRRRDGHGGHSEDGAEASGRVKRQEEECCKHEAPSPTVSERCLNERIIHVASREGAPGDCGAYHRVGDCGRRRSGDDDEDDVKSDAWDGCSVGTERAAEFDEWAATTAMERTRGDLEPGQNGAGNWSAHEGTSPASNG